MSLAVVSALPLLADFRQLGLQVVERTRQELYIDSRRLYAEELKSGQRSGPAYMWPAGVQLSALNAAAKADRKYLPWLREYADALQVYWQEHDGIAGYDVLPAPKPSDRYYDDNAWIVLALCETYEVTRDRRFLLRAEDTMRFVLSGLDEKLGGGIYWKENEKTTKNTCSNAPSAAAAFRLAKLTRKKQYIATGEALLRWTEERLRDPADGLMWDHLRLDGSIEETKWSYNTALMIRSYLELYELRRSADLLEKAKSMGSAAVKYWVRPNGAIACDAAFAHLLVESLLMLHERDRKGPWRSAAEGALTSLYKNSRSGEGYYPSRWEAEGGKPDSHVRLIDQASAARGFLLMAKRK
jgi:hypothetical protein